MKIKIQFKAFPITLAFILFVVLTSCSEKSPIKKKITHNLADDKTVYEFINYNLSSQNCDNVFDRCMPLHFTAEDSLKIIRMDTVFTKSDVDHIFKQANASESFTLKQEYMHQKVLYLDTIIIHGKDRGLYWEKIYDEYGSFCAVSWPAFSDDRKTAIIKISYSCGMLCGESGVYIYKKDENDKWKIIAVLQNIIS